MDVKLKKTNNTQQIQFDSDINQQVTKEEMPMEIDINITEKIFNFTSSQESENRNKSDTLYI